MARKKRVEQMAEFPVIEMKDLVKEYGVDETRVRALDEINLTINKGEFVAIMGPSGCGKTTLLNILGLLDSASSGQYALDGRPVEDISSSERAHIRGNQIGFVFQSFNLVPRLNVIENVALPLNYKRGFRYNKLRKASKVLKTFELQEREYYMPHQLSGGQVQRVAIARALVNNPSIILADEPTGNLDTAMSKEIMNLLTGLNRDAGITIVMVTHEPDMAAYSNRIIRFVDGLIEFDGPSAEAG
jgi:putative ABC transport system ATP-binding protein